jgi:hypothetical protein
MTPLKLHSIKWSYTINSNSTILLPIDNILVEILIFGFDPPRDNLISQLFTTVQNFINNTNRFPSSSLIC